MDINILQQFKRLISSNFILVTYHNNIWVKHEFNCIGNIKIYHKNLVKIDNEIYLYFYIVIICSNSCKD